MCPHAQEESVSQIFICGEIRKEKNLRYIKLRSMVIRLNYYCWISVDRRLNMPGHWSGTGANFLQQLARPLVLILFLLKSVEALPDGAWASTSCFGFPLGGQFHY